MEQTALSHLLPVTEDKNLMSYLGIMMGRSWAMTGIHARNATIRKFTIPGYTARDLYSSIDAELNDPALKADTIIINAGSNDLANDRFISPREVADRIAALAKKCTDHGVTQILFLLITPRKGKRPTD